MSATSSEDQTKSALGISTTQTSIAPIPKDGTEAESLPTESSINTRMIVSCSVEAAQRGLWHEAMAKNGMYRPRGMVRVLENGMTQWRENETTRWCKFSSIGLC